MELTIFNVYVAMDSQETCDRMKQLCLDNGLPIWEMFFVFWKHLKQNNFFGYDSKTKEFAIHEFCKQKTKVSEAEFIELLKEYKNAK